MNFYRRHIGDYIRDTAHLSMTEDGAYNRMLDLYYANEKPLPLDRQALYRLVRARSRDEKAAVDSVLAEYFTQHDDGWRQGRADGEITIAQAKAEANRLNGKGGGRPKQKPKNNPEETQMVSESNPKITLASNQEPVTSNQSKSRSSPARAVAAKPPDPVKDEIWQTGKAALEGEGMTRERAGSFLGKLCKDYGQVLVLQAVRDSVLAKPAKTSEWLIARCQERRSRSANRQESLEERNRKATEGWVPPEMRGENAVN